MKPVVAARLRLLALAIAAFAHALGINVVRAHVFLNLLSTSFAGKQFTLIFIWLCMAALPTFVLAPFVGALAGSRFRQATMLVAVALGLAAIGLCALQDGPWLGCLGILFLESTFFAAGRLTQVPIAARQARLWLPRVQTLLLAATGGGAIAGISVALFYFAPNPLSDSPAAIWIAMAALGTALAALVFARFQGDADAGLSGWMMRSFVEVLREIMGSRNARNCFLLLGGWLLLFLTFLGEHAWLLSEQSLYSFGLALLVGLVVGALPFNAYRVIGFTPFLLLGLFCLGIYNVLSGDWVSPVWASGILLAAMLPGLVTGFQASLSPRSWGFASAILLMWFGFMAVVFAGVIVVNQLNPPAMAATVHTLRFALISALGIFAWFVLFRPALELLMELALQPIHRIHRVGPGYDEVPWKGPCLVIANHGAMLDPLWIAKYLPLPTTPMMTSKFYDLPIISWLMRRVVGTIRVPDILVRRNAPEIQEAIAALDRGDCVVIFPEGWLRRKDEVPIRRFGRGAWEILKARPDTPVFPFWIEGGWGSYFSWKGGRLMKKRFDFWRRITIGGIGRRMVDPAILENHLATRAELMKWVLEARALLGLPPIDNASIPADGKEEQAGGE